MKNAKLLMTIICLITFAGVNAQKLTPKQIEREKNKVELYTSEERDNLQMAFYRHVKEMNLTQKNEEEYYAVVLYYTMKLNRLDDKDKGLSQKEIKKQMTAILDKLNEEVSHVLTAEQNTMHIEHMEKIIYSVNRRMERQNNKE